MELLHYKQNLWLKSYRIGYKRELKWMFYVIESKLQVSNGDIYIDNIDNVFASKNRHCALFAIESVPIKINV